MFSVSRFHTSILTCNSYLTKFFWENEFWDEQNIHELVKL